MHAFLAAEDSEAFLLAELRRAHAGQCEVLRPGLITVTPLLHESPLLVFCRQLLPDAKPRRADSIRKWSDVLLGEIVGKLPDDQPWLLHVTPHYGSGDAGRHRCELIRETLLDLLQRKRRQFRRQLAIDAAPFTPTHSLVQLLLLSPEDGLLSVSAAPQPFELRRVLSSFPKGDVPIASDKSAPSRAFAKLVEAELRLGRQIAAGETCVDLGASPGSWSYVALNRGARVIAVDRAPLRDDLMRNPRLEFRQADAFKFVPDTPVDWLLCDVIAAPERSIELVLDWVRQRRARWFVVTIKFKGHDEYEKLDELKRELPALCSEFFLTRLCANKNEACVFGMIGAPT